MDCLVFSFQMYVKMFGGDAKRQGGRMDGMLCCYVMAFGYLDHINTHIHIYILFGNFSKIKWWATHIRFRQVHHFNQNGVFIMAIEKTNPVCVKNGPFWVKIVGGKGIPIYFAQMPFFTKQTQPDEYIVYRMVHLGLFHFFSRGF